MNNIDRLKFEIIFSQPIAKVKEQIRQAMKLDKYNWLLEMMKTFNKLTSGNK